MEGFDRISRTYTDSVDYTKAQRPSLQAVPHRQNGIGSLARLGHEHRDVIAEHRGPSVEKVGSCTTISDGHPAHAILLTKLHRNWDIGQLLKYRPHLCRGSAGPESDFMYAQG